ncbi:LapA family protein [Clostridiisalibacter paucivorans]|uniref:LapA family protein n=1 Tax=Clostridiisalibacter paucivorans TaxID=408753 RepID=UPI00068814CC|nr:LapA family protein [Clostridiisalibacter paucivorans]
MQIGFIFSLILAIGVTIFAVQNADSVMINFLFTKVKVSQALVIFISAAIGAIIVTFLGMIRQFKLSMKVKELNKKVNNLETEKGDLEFKVEELETEKDKLKLEVEQYNKDIIEKEATLKGDAIKTNGEEKNTEIKENNQ